MLMFAGAFWCLRGGPKVSRKASGAHTTRPRSHEHRLFIRSSITADRACIRLFLGAHVGTVGAGNGEFIVCLPQRKVPSWPSK
ncbi:hypothetical protein CC86DRAFT_77491 [Ophiobolus disseminans]|uniref:Uncharacterized protein n=1 Tax=Ophiobolus disseminans TaxID=1469910 RepID=A0A6A6ZN67_9PLEO|nr:hypothetical protein CC86DRAFT_77491 [Ophiobolus disseminans]